MAQQRSTSYSGSSTNGGLSSSARTVSAINGSAWSSRARWYPYSLRTTLLGGKALTRQIFMDRPFSLEQRNLDDRTERRRLRGSPGEVIKRLLLHAH